MDPRASDNPSTEPATVPWNDVVRFMRQLSHDLRNHLNAAELQGAYLGEIATDPEIKSEIKRLREMMAQLGTVLQKLSVSLAQPRPTLISYRAADFIEDTQRKLTNTFPKEAPTVQWEVQLGEASIEMDPQLIQEAVLELFTNAFRHQKAGKPLKAAARVSGNRVIFELREEKQNFDSTTENWGREPLRKVTQGHYGLGLNRARAIVESHGGQMTAQYDPASSILLTTVTLPQAAERA